MKAYQRLLEYVTYPTASDENKECCPSTASQLEFARALADEMKKIGIKEVTLDENGYLFGTIPSNLDSDEGIKTIGFIAHMDVVDCVPYKNVRPKVIIGYDGGDITLNAERKIVMSPAEYDSLRGYVGDDLVVTDGTTLLGADDKAGIAEILTAAEKMINDPTIKHGKLRIGFTPDEEIGRGADRFDVARFGADFAYTLDGYATGEVEYETFNAASLKVFIKGKSIHPGSAKGKLINACRVALEFEQYLPPLAKPEYTEGREGFIHMTDMQGDVSSAELSYIIRDHDATLLECKKAYARRACDMLNAKYGEGCVTLELRDSYRNMGEMIKPHPHLIETAYEAVREAGAEPVSVPVRGGTDGSRLSFMGLPCPNLGVGAHNGHGCFEYVSIQAMDKAVDVICSIARRYGEKKFNSDGTLK